jgi:hypothetical protein
MNCRHLSDFTMWGLLKRQWRGNLPLSISFFAVGIAVQVVRFLAGLVSDYSITFNHDGLLYFAALLISYLTVLALEIWWLVGTWRSATNFESKNWSPLARAFTYACGSLIAIAYLYVAPPRIHDAYLNAMDDPEWGPRSVVLADNGKSLEINGYLTRSVVAELRECLQQNPHIRSISFDSPGGRVGPAIEIADIARSARLDTIVSRRCISACAIAFLGGQRRVILPDARLGFHGVTYIDKPDDVANGRVLSLATDVGVSRSFMRKMLSSRQILYPSVEDLVRSRAVTDVLS